MENLLVKKCIPCEGGTLPLSANAVAKYHEQTPEWPIVMGEITAADNESDDEKKSESKTESGTPQKITREWKFPDFKTALAFANQIGELAEAEGHHPDLFVSWGKVRVELSTHSIGGLSENDFILAAKIDALKK